MNSGAGSERIWVLWSRPSGYLDACLVALTNRGFDVVVRYSDVQDLTSYETVKTPELRVFGAEDSTWKELLRADQPHAVLIGGWRNRDYIRAVADVAAPKVLAMDNQWRDSVRQLAAIPILKSVVRRTFSSAFVPGVRQAEYARRLGFHNDEIGHGLYSCDTRVFSSPFEQETRTHFTFVGRLIERKGIHELRDAYVAYRSEHPAPLPLVVSGAGPLRSLFEGVAGVSVLGFSSSARLAPLLRTSAALVLPSRFEAWGVVVHEAACSGAPVIATTEVGAVDALVNERSGIVMPRVERAAITEALLQITNWTPERMSKASAESVALSRRFSPDLWADTLLALARIGN